MKTPVRKKDLDMAIGMMCAFDAMKDSNRTALQTLDTIMGNTSPGEDFIWDMCEQRAAALIEAVEEVSLMVDLSEVAAIDKNESIKMSAVMTAICEMILVTSTGKGFENLSALSVENSDPQEVLDQLSGGYDPKMISMVSGHIVRNSYPQENPTKEIITSLWIEGYVTAILGPSLYDELKNSEFVKKFMRAISEEFIILPD
jgi:hypothetical protein